MKEDFSIFDILKSVSYEKVDYSEAEDFNKRYSAFMINRFLAADPETLLFANVMSRMDHLPSKLQFQFYFYGIDKKRRYFKYAKKDKGSGKTIEVIAQHFNVNMDRASEMMELLDKNTINKIKNSFKEGITKG